MLAAWSSGNAVGRTTLVLDFQTWSQGHNKQGQGQGLGLQGQGHGQGLECETCQVSYNLQIWQDTGF